MTRDPAYAEAQAALAECLVRMTVNGWTADKAASTAHAATLAALDPENAPVLAIAAWAYATLGVRFEHALELADRALALHPNSGRVRSFCGWASTDFGQSLKAIAQFEEARRLSPVDPKSYFPMLGLFAGDFDSTVSLTGRILAEVPTHNVARRYRDAALAHLGRLEDARAVIADLLVSQPSSTLRNSRSSAFRDQRMSDLYIEGLGKAGLPA